MVGRKSCYALFIGLNMSLFQCEKCGCIENTATSDYWMGNKSICSECTTGKWHNVFPKQSAKGYLLGNDGFLYTKEDNDSGGLDWRKKYQGFEIVKEII